MAPSVHWYAAAMAPCAPARADGGSEARDLTRGRPAAEAVYRQLLGDLNRGVYGPGSRLPAERELANRLETSRSTLRLALNRLAREERVASTGQRGWHVSGERIGEPPSILQSFTEMATARGLTAHSRILLQEMRPCSYDESLRLGVAPATPVVEIRRLRFLGPSPVCVDRSVVHLAEPGALAELDLVDRSLYAALADLAGVEITRSSYAVEARAADEELARQLGIDLGSPVLVGTETAYDDRGRPIILGEVKYRGDAYRFKADLFRPVS